MRNKLLALAAVGLMATAAMTGCDDADQGSDAGSGNTTAGSGDARIGVILPDTKSSQRWKVDDPKYLKEAFDAAGVKAEIRNAEGDKEEFKRIGLAMIESGVKVLVIANLDSVSGKVVLDAARAEKIPTIDYDRLTLNGGADYYVSFDNKKVGNQQAYALQNCLKDKKASNPIVAQLNGSRTDNNATLFKEGYDEVLQKKYDAAAYTKGPEQWVPDWDNEEAGRIFEQMLEQQPAIDGVLAANDGIGNAVIEVLRKKKLAGKIPVTGQDATVQGLQNILTGEQCMTVYKRIKPEAQTAANLAIKLFKGERPSAPDRAKDPESGAQIPFVALPPQPITIDNVNDVVADGFVSKAELCKGKYAQLCVEHGVGESPAPTE
jgi:D-xylose transport system substrate-binding protein